MLDHFLKRLAALEQEVCDLRRRNEYLEKKLADHKTVEIGKIIYKIQEISVKTLSGMLNVGISATNSDEQTKWIEELIKDKKIEWEVDDTKSETEDT